MRCNLRTDKHTCGGREGLVGCGGGFFCGLRDFFLVKQRGGGWVRGSWAVNIICGCLRVCVGGVGEGKRYVRKEGVESGMGKLCELGFYASFGFFFLSFLLLRWMEKNMSKKTFFSFSFHIIGVWWVGVGKFISTILHPTNPPALPNRVCLSFPPIFPTSS